MHLAPDPHVWNTTHATGQAPIRVKLPHLQGISHQFRFALPRTGRYAKPLIEFIGADMGVLRPIKEKIDHANGVGNTSGPSLGLTLAEGGRSLPTEGRSGLPNQLGIFRVEMLLRKFIGEGHNAVELLNHCLGNVCRFGGFSHSTGVGGK